MVSQEKSKSFAIIWYQGKQKKDRPSIGFNFKKRSDLEIHVLGFVICTYCGPLYVAGFVLFNVIGINRLAKMNIWEFNIVPLYVTGFVVINVMGIDHLKNEYSRIRVCDARWVFDLFFSFYDFESMVGVLHPYHKTQF